MRTIQSNIDIQESQRLRATVLWEPLRSPAGNPRRWRTRWQQRTELSTLSQRDFADMGVSSDMATWEANKWFWRDWDAPWNDARKR